MINATLLNKPEVKFQKNKNTKEKEMYKKSHNI